MLVGIANSIHKHPCTVHRKQSPHVHAEITLPMLYAGKNFELELTRFGRHRRWKLCGWCRHFLEDKGAVELAGLGEAAVSGEGKARPEMAEQGSCVL